MRDNGEMGRVALELRFYDLPNDRGIAITRMNRPRPVNAENEKKEARLRLLPQCYLRLVHSP